MALSFFASPHVPINGSLICYGYGYLCGVPTVTGVSPNVGPMAGGTGVTITGTNFNNTSVAVHFGSAMATSVVVVSDTSITANSPASASPGTVDVVVTTNAGSSATSSADQFTFQQPGPCANAGLSANLASPQPSGTTITFTATSTGCTSPQYKYYIGFGSPTTWILAQDYDGPTYVWNTFGDGATTYTIDVWARQAGHSAAFETFQTMSYTLSTTPACAGAAVAADKASPQMSGTIVTLTGSSTACPNPEYKFWIGFGSPTTWVLARDYGGATFVWNTAGDGAVAYTVDVWAREMGTGVAQQSAGLLPYTLTTPVACTTSAITPDKMSAQQVGTVVTFTASSAACSQPMYRFWVQPPGGSWMMVRDFSSSANYVWNTAGLATGTYNIDIWAHQNGSATAAETGAAIAYTLTPAQACAGANVTPDLASPQAHGTTITFTAVSTTCSEPIYKYWIQPPGGGWYVASDGSLSGTFVWNTTGLAAGTYNIDVWVYDNGSSSVQSFKLITYTLT